MYGCTVPPNGPPPRGFPPPPPPGTMGPCPSGFPPPQATSITTQSGLPPGPMMPPWSQGAARPPPVPMATVEFPWPQGVGWQTWPTPPAPGAPGMRWTSEDSMCYGAAKRSEALHHASTVWKDRVIAEDAYWRMDQRFQNAEWRDDARRDARPLIQAQANELGREMVRERNRQGQRQPEGYALGDYGYDGRGPAWFLNDDNGGSGPPPLPPPAGMSFPTKGGSIMYPMPPPGSAAEQAQKNAMLRSFQGGAMCGGAGSYQY
mmetsp:Transcript_36534/g.66960  ORF Transcript_36534/g.66960 Transcript_36534/m.66960 type:complete len:261 (-) Transcript_36534:95-877(-)